MKCLIKFYNLSESVSAFESIYNMYTVCKYCTYGI